MERDKLVWVEKEKTGTDLENEIWLRSILTEEFDEIYLIIRAERNIKNPNTFVSIKLELNNPFFSNFDSNIIK